jgi:hypothetical protein
MSSAQRFTTEYVVYEDRVRLTYLIPNESAHVAWLTHRFSDRLVTHLVTWLEKSVEPVSRGEILQGFAQDLAVSKLLGQPPVLAETSTQSWVVYSVDVSFNENAVHLVLKNQDVSCKAEFSMNIIQLRQWLNILHKQYIVAGWSLTCWPNWLVEQNQPVGNTSKIFH